MLTEDELWLGYYKKASGRPSVDWSQAVDECLCVGWIDGVRKSIDDEVQRPAPDAPPQGQQLERHQRREGREADRGGPDAAGRPGRVRGADRREHRDLLATNGRQPVR